MPVNRKKSIDKRAISISQLYAKKYKLMKFEGIWHDSFGDPELTGTWLIYGPAKNGKTRLASMLAKLLCQHGRVAYNSLEEGVSVSIREAFQAVKMEEVGRTCILLDKESIDDVKKRLRARKSPDVIIIDSIQYTGMNYAEYKSLKDEFRNKLFIFISHAEGRDPAGRVAKSVKYDANITVRVEGYKAFINGRYGGGEPFIIWPEGAARYWSKI